MRRKERQFELDFNPPVMKDNPDFNSLKKTCQNLIDDVRSEGCYDEDFHQYVFEAAMEACFGKDVWHWLRENNNY
jgi:hypothetical protein